MRPSGSWPIAPRAWRPLSCREGNASPAWKVGLPFLHEQRPAADRARETAPVGREREPGLDLLPHRGFRRELGGRLCAACDEHGAAGRDRRRPRARHLRHGSVERLVQASCGKRPDHRLDDSRLGRRRGAVRRGVEGELPRLRRCVEGQRAPLAVPLPDPAQGDAIGRERAVRGDAEARAPGRGLALEHTALQVDPARRPGRLVEVVAVDRHRRRAAGHPLLEVREGFLAAQLAVRERRRERVDLAVGLRHRHDVEDDRAARREVHLARVGHAGQQERARDRARAGAPDRGRADRCPDDRRQRDADEKLPQQEHDPRPRVALPRWSRP